MSQSNKKSDGLDALTRDGKYLSFTLDDTEYAIQITKVREIIGMMEITPMPRTPDFVRGCMNLRDQIIPVLELRDVLEMDTVDDNGETRIIVVELGQTDVGLVVDRVCEVLDMTESEIDDPPEFGVSVSTEFVLGIGKREDRVTILLDISKVLSPGATSELSKIAKAA